MRISSDRHYEANVGPIIVNQRNLCLLCLAVALFLHRLHVDARFAAVNMQQAASAESQFRDMAFVGDELRWMQEHRGIDVRSFGPGHFSLISQVRVNVISAFLVGSGFYIQL
jgi:hypothetical protein